MTSRRFNLEDNRFEISTNFSCTFYLTFFFTILCVYYLALQEFAGIIIYNVHSLTYVFVKGIYILWDLFMFAIRTSFFSNTTIRMPAGAF